MFRKTNKTTINKNKTINSYTSLRFSFIFRYFKVFQLSPNIHIWSVWFVITCGQYFNKLDNLARHRAQHERPEAKQRLLTKILVAPELGPVTKQQRTVSPPTNTHQEKSRVAADTEVLPDDPETRPLYIKHWQSIQTEKATGNRVQDRYNFTLHEMTASTFTEVVRRIFREQTTAFKINVSFGFSYDIWKPVNYATTIPARTTPNCFMFHTSSELKKTCWGF